MTARIWTLPAMVAAAMSSADQQCSVQIGRGEDKHMLSCEHLYYDDNNYKLLSFGFSISQKKNGVGEILRTDITTKEASNLLTQQKALTPTKKAVRKATKKTAKAAKKEAKSQRKALGSEALARPKKDIKKARKIEGVKKRKGGKAAASVTETPPKH